MMFTLGFILWAVGIDVLAYLIHLKTGFKLHSGPPTIIMFFGPWFMVEAQRRGWLFFHQQRLPISEDISLRFQRFSKRIGVVGLTLEAIKSDEIGALYIGDKVRLTSGAIDGLSNSGVDFILCHELTHAVLKRSLRSVLTLRLMAGLSIGLISIMLVALKFEVPVWGYVLVVMIGMLPLLLLLKYGPRALWKGADAEFACDYVAAVMIEDSRGAVETLEAMNHGTDRQRKQFNYPSGFERVERIRDLLDGNKRRPFVNEKLELAARMIWL